jgi:Fe2+ transport system protein FeoA
LPVKSKAKEVVFVEGHCTHSATCPLSHVKAGTTVCIKEHTATPEVTSRLRELGFCEDAKVRLVSQATNIICEVCNARLGLSKKLAETIMVQPVLAHAKRRS